MGITGPDRTEYWSLIWWVLTRMPTKFAMAITLTVYGYHFRQVAKLHLGNVVEKENDPCTHQHKAETKRIFKSQHIV